MNPLEQFAVTIILGVLNTVVKNPAHKAAMQGQMIGLATDIAATYGYTLTAPPALATAPGAASSAAYTRPIGS